MNRVIAFSLLAAAAFAQTAAELNNLGAARFAAGDTAQAERLFHAALANAGDALTRAKIIGNLAALKKRECRYTDAAALFERALELRRAALGEDHVDVAVAWNNLGEARRLEGRPEDAARLFERALAILEPRPGSGADAGLVLANLAELRRAAGKLTEAEAMLRRALVRLEETAGGSRQMAIALNNLAELLMEAGDLDGAEPLHRRAVAIWDSAAGAPLDQAISWTNLGRLEQARGRYVEAESLHRRAIGRLEDARLEATPVYAAALHNLGSLFAAQSRFEAARDLMERAFAITGRALGPNHPSLAGPALEYAVVLRRTRRKSEAARIEARVRAIVEEHRRDGNSAQVIDAKVLRSLRPKRSVRGFSTEPRP
ncbi:MAG: tetratricopeptide repeat protein [Bryobacteraceae bacterium]